VNLSLRNKCDPEKFKIAFVIRSINK
jgi:hypothetical protein